jgi:hypothetical protein
VRVAFDAVMLGAYLHPNAHYPKPVDSIPERIAQLIKDLEAADAKIVVPTPVLSEFLVLAGADGAAYLAEMTTSDLFEIQPFDIVAAVEGAAMMAKAKESGDKRSGAAGRWQVVKVDYQFVAISKVHGVECIYSDDDDVRKLANAAGIVVKGMADLPSPPPVEKQPELFAEEDAELELPPQRLRAIKLDRNDH